MKNTHPLLCPICSSELVAQNGIFLCPQQHGLLLTSRQLRDAKREKRHALQPAKTHVPDSQQNVTCPNCGQPMHKVNYNDMEIVIDSCLKCHYRWLDTGELDRIVSHKPDMSPEDILFVAELDQKRKELAGEHPANHNPKSPLHNSVLGGLIRGHIASDSRKVFGALAGVGFGGLIKGMIESKFMRVFGVIFLIVFGVICYFIWKALTQIDFPQLYNGR